MESSVHLFYVFSCFRIVEMERVKMLVDSFPMSCGLGCTGWGGVKIPVVYFYLLSELG